MQTINPMLIIILSWLLLSACGASDTVKEDTVKESTAQVNTVKDDSVLCKSPRPQMCTMDYTPVCGLNKDNSRKTYSNACGACSNISVISYRANSCETSVK